MCVFVYTHIHISRIREIEPMNLKGARGRVGRISGGKGRERMICYILIPINNF